MNNIAKYIANSNCLCRIITKDNSCLEGQNLVKDKSVSKDIYIHFRTSYIKIINQVNINSCVMKNST